MTLPAGAQDILILGEIHDNPHHHAVQAERVMDLQPKALVFEMVSPDRFYGEVVPEYRSPTGLQDYLDWDASGWPDFTMYHPIFDAAPDARIYGAHVPGDAAREAASRGVAAAFGNGAMMFGLDDPLPENQQVAREALQAAAHCDALPDEMLAPMVEIQRLRDALIARAAIDAFRATGGPVAVITGNGHARKDWGVPALLARVADAPDMHVVGQTEDDAPLQGGFDEVVSSPVQPRPDPCLAFQ
ncbi:ChaN family lipoprotein [Roseovarius sp. CAU 1744]|uniref:ChaN family lipoprotein n=1 Tax=Roseovarius sp. CAU 1744 TaxID=3140368 RepID=UPI00325AE187